MLQLWMSWRVKTGRNCSTSLRRPWCSLCQNSWLMCSSVREEAWILLSCCLHLLVLMMIRLVSVIGHTHVECCRVICSLIPNRENTFSPFRKRPYWLRIPWASYSVVPWGFFPMGKVAGSWFWPLTTTCAKVVSHWNCTSCPLLCLCNLDRAAPPLPRVRACVARTYHTLRLLMVVTFMCGA